MILAFLNSLSKSYKFFNDDDNGFYCEMTFEQYDEFVYDNFPIEYWSCFLHENGHIKVTYYNRNDLFKHIEIRNFVAQTESRIRPSDLYTLRDSLANQIGTHCNFTIDNDIWIGRAMIYRSLPPISYITMKGSECIIQIPVNEIISTISWLNDPFAIPFPPDHERRLHKYYGVSRNQLGTSLVIDSKKLNNDLMAAPYFTYQGNGKITLRNELEWYTLVWKSKNDPIFYNVLIINTNLYSDLINIVISYLA